MKFKKKIRFIHLWLGLASGLIVFIVAITGAIYTFEDEIQNTIYAHRVVIAENKPYKKPSEILAIAKKQLGERKVNSIEYHGKNNPVTVTSYQPKPEELWVVYINPYSGKILKIKNEINSFFITTYLLHTSLLMGDFGKVIVSYAVLIFLFMIITGIIMWWPKRKNKLKSSFSIKWGASPKKLNYDLHNILGFYVSWIVVFIAITGLTWSFTWMDKAVYFVTSVGEPYKDWIDPKSVSDPKLKTNNNIVDSIFFNALQKFNSQYESITIHFPSDDKKAVYLVDINPNHEIISKSTAYFYDQRTALFIEKSSLETMSTGEKIRHQFYDMHIGKMFGLTGQIIVCLTSLIVASLPITGFMIWWRRRKGLNN